MKEEEAIFSLLSDSEANWLIASSLFYKKKERKKESGREREANERTDKNTQITVYRIHLCPKKIVYVISEMKLDDNYYLEYSDY